VHEESAFHPQRLLDLPVEKLPERLAGEMFDRMAHGNIHNVLILLLRSGLDSHGEVPEGSDQARHCGVFGVVVLFCRVRDNRIDGRGHLQM
jgi:hypothetical protein